MTGHQIPSGDPPVATPAEAADRLRRRFRVPVWYGNHTHHFWAMVTNQLVEAETGDQLGRLLEAGWSPPRRP